MELDHFELIIQIIEAASGLRRGALLSNSELRGEGGNTASYNAMSLSTVQLFSRHAFPGLL